MLSEDEKRQIQRLIDEAKLEQTKEDQRALAELTRTAEPEEDPEELTERIKDLDLLKELREKTGR
jgi:hypothetical protein